MASFIVERNGFVNAQTLMAALITDLIANGFTLQYPSQFTGTEQLPFKVYLEASTTVDPLAATQPWRIGFDVQHIQTAFVYLGTPTTLPNNGTLPAETVTVFVQGNGGGSFVSYLGDVVGNCGSQMGATPALAIDEETGIWNPITQPDNTLIGFINRRYRTGNGNKRQGSTSVWEDENPINSAITAPMSYRLVIGPHGVWFGVWEDAVSGSSGDYFNWVLIQRPVDRNTGAVVTTGKAPVFCVNKAGASHWQFVVRENDVLRPSGRRSASEDTDDSEGILNIENQVGLSEDGKYVVTFPSRLNTSRYRYPHELDMIATTSSDVVSQYSDVPLEVYGEAEARIYKAMFSNKTGSTGMRLLVINEGGGVGS